MTENQLLKRFGENLQYCMESSGMTQIELSKASRLSQSMISYYIRGERMPTLKSINNLTIALECDINDLIEIDWLID